MSGTTSPVMRASVEIREPVSLAGRSCRQPRNCIRVGWWYLVGGSYWAWVWCTYGTLASSWHPRIAIGFRDFAALATSQTSSFILLVSQVGDHTAVQTGQGIERVLGVVGDDVATRRSPSFPWNLSRLTTRFHKFELRDSLSFADYSSTAHSIPLFSS